MFLINKNINFQEDNERVSVCQIFIKKQFPPGFYPEGKIVLTYLKSLIGLSAFGFTSFEDD